MNKENPDNNKNVIYQIFTRLFGNSNQTNKIYGTIEDNGCGKFNDISDKALEEIKKLGATHIYYTGILKHATCTEYEKYGIKKNNPLVIKGLAGSPFAITDYYDVDPDLANNVDKRMEEFKSMIERTHKNDLKAIIDFIPNHVAREYKSQNLPPEVKNLGEEDDCSKPFLQHNNFYYLPDQSFKVPEKVFEQEFIKNLGVTAYDENPAKATGNDLFKPNPDFEDWYETIKLNYGVDFQGNNEKYFDQVPNTWIKMKHILLFWASQNIDGFRCDMAEMAPTEFWSYAIREVKKEYPDGIFIAEIYNQSLFEQFAEQCGFDYLYDKEIFYNTTRKVVEGNTPAWHITSCWQKVEGYEEKMLRFMENHDEQRIASDYFAGDPCKGIPAMVVAATMGKGPVMLYFAQEAGEAAKGACGFSGDDGRTTIFDYWGVLQHQKWLNHGKFDGERFSDKEKNLYETYRLILNLCKNPLISNGDFYDLMWYNINNPQFNPNNIYTYLRYKNGEAFLIVVNFSAENKLRINIQFPKELAELINVNYNFTLFGQDVMPGEKSFACDSKEVFDKGIFLIIKPLAAHVFNLEFDPW